MLKKVEFCQFDLKQKITFKIKYYYANISPVMINLKLFDFFNVFIVKIDAKAVIMNRKRAKIANHLSFDLNNFYHSLYSVNFYNLKLSQQRTWYPNC